MPFSCLIWYHRWFCFNLQQIEFLLCIWNTSLVCIYACVLFCLWFYKRGRIFQILFYLFNLLTPFLQYIFFPVHLSGFCSRKLTLSILNGNHILCLEQDVNHFHVLLLWFCIYWTSNPYQVQQQWTYLKSIYSTYYSFIFCSNI